MNSLAPRTRGFTLLEVLLALAILAVIVTSIYQSFSTAGRSVQQAEEVRDGTDEARTFLARLTNDLANAFVAPGMSETFFYGTKSEDEETKKRYDGVFLTTLTNWRRPGTKEMELWGVGYYFQERPEDNKRVLYRREKRELSKDIPPLEGGVEYELTDKVDGLRLRYSGDGSAWVDEWDTKRMSKPPRAVEIVLTIADGRVYTTKVDIRRQ